MAKVKMANMSAPLQRGFEFVDNATSKVRLVTDKINQVGSMEI